MLLRIILIIVAVYLVARYLRAILAPRSKDNPIKGKPRDRGERVNRDQIQDATFKDISNDET